MFQKKDHEVDFRMQAFLEGKYHGQFTFDSCLHINVEIKS